VDYLWLGLVWMGWRDEIGFARETDLQALSARPTRSLWLWQKATKAGMARSALRLVYQQGAWCFMFL